MNTMKKKTNPFDEKTKKDFTKQFEKVSKSLFESECEFELLYRLIKKIHEKYYDHLLPSDRSLNEDFFNSIPDIDVINNLKRSIHSTSDYMCLLIYHHKKTL